MPLESRISFFVLTWAILLCMYYFPSPLTHRQRILWPIALLLCIYLWIAGPLIVSPAQLEAALGVTVGRDFRVFYSGSAMALQGPHGIHGNILLAFDPDLLLAVQQTMTKATVGILPWIYPPTFAAMITPLALLSFINSFWVWTLAGAGLYALMLWRILPDRLTLMLGFAYTGAYVNFVQGQSGLFVTAFMGLAMLLIIEKKSWLAGFFFGLLAIKPQYGFLIPVALLASREWQTFISASITLILFLFMVTVAFGVEYWTAFFNMSSDFSNQVADWPKIWLRMTSVWAASRVLGLNNEIAVLIQAGVALGVVATVAYIWFRYGARSETAAAVIAGTCLLQPYILFYDLVVLAPAMALLIREGLQRNQLLRGEIAIYLLVGIFPAIAGPLSLPIGPLAPIMVFSIALARLYYFADTENSGPVAAPVAV